MSNDPLADVREVAASMGVRMTPMKGEAFNVDELLGTGEWSYQEFPWMHSMLLDKMLEALGEGEVHMLARTTRGEHSRGQFLISNKGRENFREKAQEVSDLFDSLKVATPGSSSPN